MGNLKQVITIFVVVVLIGGSGYLLSRLFFAKQKAAVLQDENYALSMEKNRLVQQLENEQKTQQAREVTLTMLRKELAELEDTRKIKELYSVNLGKLNSLDNTFKQSEKEKAELKQTNLSLSARLQNITAEFTKTLETLKAVKLELDRVKNDKASRSLQVKITKLEETLMSREKTIAALQLDLQKISKDAVRSNSDKKILEKKISGLEKERDLFKAQAQETRESFEKKYGDKSAAGKKIAELKQALSEKESQSRALQDEVQALRRVKAQLDRESGADNEKAALQKELDDLKTKLSTVDALEREKAELLKQLEQLRGSLNNQEKIIAELRQQDNNIPEIQAAVTEVGVANSSSSAAMQDKLNKAYALYDTAKAQVVKFTELLMSKEIELETAKQKIKSLEDELQGGRPEMAAQNSQSGDYRLLQDRIRMLSDALEKKEKEAKEKDSALAVLSTAKTALEERLQYQEKEFGNVNTLYTNLRDQLMQTRELLSRKELELSIK
jgi:hypothetical protein